LGQCPAIFAANSEKQYLDKSTHPSKSIHHLKIQQFREGPGNF
jgi:hypothetical protein